VGRPFPLTGRGPGARTHLRQRTDGVGRKGCRLRRLCRSLCPNLRIPARVGPSRMVSLCNRRKAVNMPGTRMDAYTQCHSVSSGVLPSDFTR
jgi:hypothetical protein